MKDKLKMLSHPIKLNWLSEFSSIASFKTVRIVFVMFLTLITFNSVAAVDGPSITSENNFKITWTSTSSCNGYRIMEYKSGVYTRTYNLYSSTPKYYNFTSKAAGSYRYEVYYGKCAPSGTTYLSTGEHLITVLSSVDALRDITFIHTDLLGTPVAETDINGELN